MGCGAFKSRQQKYELPDRSGGADFWADEPRTEG
eukprot:gene5692-10629_t